MPKGKGWRYWSPKPASGWAIADSKEPDLGSRPARHRARAERDESPGPAPESGTSVRSSVGVGQLLECVVMDFEYFLVRRLEFPVAQHGANRRDGERLAIRGSSQVSLRRYVQELQDRFIDNK